MPATITELSPVVLSFALALALTPAVRALARRWGAVARPRSDRWHKQPTALLGGIAIFLAVAVTYFTVLDQTPETLVVMLASAFLWLVGLLDDLVCLKPYQKLVGQVVGAAAVTACGLHLPWTPWPLVNMAVTMFWLVGITNAVNLLDNMDGLAAGVAGIASAFLAAACIFNGQAAEALLLGVLAAALLGFLVYNSSPASIFMGDCGSMFIGFFLAGAALLHPTGGRSRSFLPVLAVPVLVLLIPIFNVVLVTAMRKLAGRSVAQGGRDHTSHRLVALGLSERRAVGLLYGLAMLSGCLALLVRDLQLDVSLALIGAFTVGLTLLGVYLAGVKVYDEKEVRAAQEKPLVAFLIDLSYKRRVFEVLLDVVLILLAQYSAFALVFGPLWETGPGQAFRQALPVCVLVKLVAFLGTGVYRGLWRYVGVDDLLVYGKAVLLGEGASVLAVVFLFRFEGFSRVVFVLDGLLLLVLLGGSRVAFRLFRSLFPQPTPPGRRRVLIYGAGDAGVLLLRELRGNLAREYVPVGFADDDTRKEGKSIHGLRVFGGNGSLRRICQAHGVEEVWISSERIPGERTKAILQDCVGARVALKRMRITFEPLLDGDSPYRNHTGPVSVS